MLPPRPSAASSAPCRPRDHPARHSSRESVLPFHRSLCTSSSYGCSTAGGSCSEFSTSAAAPPTHWKQTVLYLNKPQAVQAGSKLHGTISFRRQGAYKRAYDVSVVYHIDGVQCDVQMWHMQ